MRIGFGIVSSSLNRIENKVQNISVETLKISSNCSFNFVRKMFTLLLQYVVEISFIYSYGSMGRPPGSTNLGFRYSFQKFPFLLKGFKNDFEDDEYYLKWLNLYEQFLPQMMRVIDPNDQKLMKCLSIIRNAIEGEKAK